MKTENKEITIDLLTINFEVRDYLETMLGNGITVHEVKREKIPNETVTREANEFLQTIETLVRHDIENTKKCFEFIDSNFPHVMYSYSDNAVEIHNLTGQEKKFCSLQSGLNFKC